MSTPRTAADSSPSLPAPLNQRMLEATSGLRKAIDKTRSRLLTSGDRYDSAAYRSARNAFTLTREAYDTQLYHNHVSAPLEDVVRVEGPLREQLLAADGASFPQAIEAAADFLKTRIFATA